MKNQSLVAIDPGKKGGIAIYDLGEVVTVNAYPMPMAGKGIDFNTVASIISQSQPLWIVIEKVGAMPGQGVTSMFTFGMGYGAMLGIAAALSIPVELVRPQKWKDKILHGTAKDKDAAIEFCRRAYPSVNLIPPRCRKPHDGIADALCLMEYGRRELMGSGT